jgi:hypothetical protein
MSSREERITQLVALCVHHDKTPANTPAFADFVIQATASAFGSSKRTAKDYALTLVNCWRANKWRNYIQENLYLPEEERKRWLNEQC